MTQITVRWSASKELRRAEYAATGEKPAENRDFMLDLVGLMPEQREPIITFLGLNRYELVMWSAYQFNPKWFGSMLEPENLAFDRQPTVDDIVDYVKSEVTERSKARVHKAKVNAAKQAKREQMQAHYDEIKPRLEVLVEQGNLAALNAFTFSVKGIASFKPSGGRSNLYKLLSDGIKDLRKAKREADKTTWIEAHGSDYLKRAHAGDYDAQRLYVTERSAMEAPGFIVDFDEKAEWRDRTCPSLDALDAETEAKKLGIGEEVEVVWLVNPAANRVQGKEEGYYVFDAVEAVVIRNYLGRYDLVREL